MQQWAAGEFEAGPDDWHTIPAPPNLDALDVKDQPFALDKAALDACVGASFYPGIEAPRILRDGVGLYEAPFRIHRELPPGTVTHGLALPWQTDFWACGIGWWPGQRPNSVFRKGQRNDWDHGVTKKEQMIDMWKFLGFVLPSTDVNIPYAEDERDHG
jgi:hypothetical protein